MTDDLPNRLDRPSETRIRRARKMAQLLGV
jgi:hypothetical protein